MSSSKVKGGIRQARKKIVLRDGATDEATIEHPDGVGASSTHELPAESGTQRLVSRTSTDTLTNKSIDADTNTITNIEDADIKAGAAIDTTKLADGSVSNAEFQKLDSAGTDATDELVKTDSTQTVTNKTIVAANNTITTAASGNLTSTELDAALSELQTDIDTRALDSDLTTHIADTTTHGTTGDIVGTSDTQSLTNKTIVAASNTITTAASGNLTSTELDAALAELQADVDTRALDSDLNTHISDTTTHGTTGDIVGTSDTQTLTNKTVVAASNTITTAASGNLTSTELNAALAELQTDVDTRALDSDLTTHTADTSTHGTTGNVVGDSDTQTLTNKTIVAANNTITTAASGNLTATELDAALAELQTDIDTRATSTDLSNHISDTTTHGTTGNIVGTSDVQSMSNKTFTDRTQFTSTDSVKIPAGTTAQQTGSPTDGDTRFNTDTQSLETYSTSASAWIPAGSGSGAGEINYITNPGAELNADDWTGSANFAVTRTTTAAEILRDDASFKFATTVSATTSDKIYTDFSIDQADQNKLLKIQFDVLADANYTDGDVEVYIVEDPTGAATDITPSLTALGASDSGASQFLATWVSTSTSDYRLEFRVATASTAFNLYVDNVIVGPGKIITGAAISGETSIPSAGSLFSNLSAITVEEAVRWRVGDKLGIRIRANSVTSSGGTVNFTLPDGLSLASTTPLVQGDFSIDDTGQIFIVYRFDSNTVAFWGAGSAVGGGSYPLSSDTIQMDIMVTVAEWVGSGTVNLGAGQVEYVSHDGTNIVYGPSGAVIPTTTPSGDFEQYIITSAFPNIQPTDIFRLQVQIGGEGAWTDTGEVNISDLKRPGGTGAWIGASMYQSSTAELYMIRGKYRTEATTLWSTIDAGTRWRVVKHAAGAPVGFGIAQNGEAGLISHYDEGSGDLGTLEWFGTGPTTLQVKKYKWVRVGNRVDFFWNIEYATPGSAITVLRITFPGDAPVPGTSLLNSTSGGNWIANGCGHFADSDSTSAGVSDTGCAVALERTSGGAFRLYMYPTNGVTQDPSNAQGHLTYFVDG